MAIENRRFTSALTQTLRSRTAYVALALAALGAVLGGCVTNGRDFKSDTQWIKESKTKKADVQMVLGEPYSVGNSAGRPTWTYGYYHYQLVGKSQQKELKLYWNDDGTVNTFSFNSSFPEDTSGATPAATRAPAPAAKPLVP